MYRITRTVEFSAAHHLPTLPEGHKCKRPHGHNYKVTVQLRADELDADGFVMDFGVISQLVRQYDHRDLNDFIKNPTAEILARTIFDQIVEHTSGPVSLLSVAVYETDDCMAVYAP